MAKPEDDLCRHVKARLDYWQYNKIVIHYDDVRRLGLKVIRGQWISHKKKGTPDIIAYFKHKDICGILLIELKTKNDTHKEHQIEYMLKFKDLTNVHYIILRDPKQIDETLENITHHFDTILEGIDL